MSKPPVPPDRSDGPVPGTPDADDGRSGDAGLFGPDSVTWRVHAEPLMAVAGLRALLLQALHPVAVAAFAEHSTYREDWWGRLSRTGEYIAVTTFVNGGHLRMLYRWWCPACCSPVRRWQ